MKKKLLILILFFLLFIYIGCFTLNKKINFHSQKQLLQPRQVVENYFKYYNEKNREGLLSTLTEEYNNTVWGFENLEYIRANSITKDTNPIQKEAYMKYGRGNVNDIKEENVIVYRVEYEVKYKNDRISSQNSGKKLWWFTVIRKDENSPWLIDEFGEG